MKTGAWLRGGRGKIAGMVAQKSSDGKGTVLRELVIPSNPQSVDQMATRLAFGTVTQAAALMLPIIGQTFKGQGDEKMNRRRFVSLNVPLLKAEALSQQAGNVAAGLFRGKNSTALIPNSYIVSEGSLSSSSKLSVNVITGVEQTVGMSIEVTNNYTFEVGRTYNAADILAGWFGVDKTQQITVVAIATINADVNYNANNGDFVRGSEFYGRRIVFNEDSNFTVTANMTAAQLKEYLLEGLNLQKSSAGLQVWLEDAITYDNEQHYVSIDSDLLEGFDASYDYLKFRAAAIIVSQLKDGIWDYSSERMTFRPNDGSIQENNPDYSGLTFGNALVDYLGADAASKLYTRKGGLINDI